MKERAIYFIRCGEDGPIKIGVATDVEGRYRSIQNGNHIQLWVMAVIRPGDTKIETDLHHRFAEHHIRGEWFHPAPDLLSFINELPEYISNAELARRKRMSPIGQPLQCAPLGAHKIKKRFYPKPDPLDLILDDILQAKNSKRYKKLGIYEKI